MIDYANRGKLKDSEWQWEAQPHAKDNKDKRKKDNIEGICLSKNKSELLEAKESINKIKKAFPELFKKVYLNPIEVLEMYVTWAIKTK